MNITLNINLASPPEDALLAAALVRLLQWLPVEQTVTLRWVDDRIVLPEASM